MRIVIVGAGRMGFHLAQDLDREGHEVFLLDPDPACTELAQTRLDVMAIPGSGCSRATLREAGAEGADLLLAVSGSDEVNIVSCLIGRELGVRHRVARIDSRALLADIHDLKTVLGVDEYVSPRQVTLERLHRILSVPGTTESAEFADGRIILRALRVDTDSPLTAAPLSELRHRFAHPFLITAVRRGDELFVPKGTFRVETGDIVYVVMHAGRLDAFLQRFRLAHARSRKVFVFGATGIGLDLCNRLAREGWDAVLLDKKESACKEAAEQVDRTAVVQGSPLDGDLMQDLKIKNASFLSLTESAEVNFASAVMAKRLGARRAIMLATQPEEAKTFDVPPLDAVISPISASVGAILRAVRAGRVLSLFKLAGNRGEALEVEAQAGAPGTGRPLREVTFPEGAVVAAVTGRQGTHVASGETLIQPGEHAIVVSLNGVVHEAIRLFATT